MGIVSELRMIDAFGILAGMETLLCLIGGAALAFETAGLAVALLGVWRAPVGFEDHGGFHLGAG